MSSTGDAPPSLVELTPAQCWELLASRPVGRLAFQGTSGIVVLPVNHETDGSAIVLRTSPYSHLARDCAGRDVAFEVDAIDEDLRTGWSVLAQGRCEREAPGPQNQTDTWAGPGRTLALRIEVSGVSGRRLS